MNNKQIKNKLKTASYFVKRLKDSGFETWKIFNKYSESDPRRWTVLIDPGGASIYITCFENKPFYNEYLFTFDDGNVNFRPGFSLKTDSIEVIVNRLLSNGAGQRDQRDSSE